MNIEPMPEAIRAIPKRWRPRHPPIFDCNDGPISREDAELAIALIEALDDESREWYANSLDRLRAILG